VRREPDCVLRDASSALLSMRKVFVNPTVLMLRSRPSAGVSKHAASIDPAEAF